MNEPLGLSDCEALTEALLMQPVNAISSLAFVIAAAIAALLLHTSNESTSPLAWASCASLGLIGFGSFDYHGPQSAAANTLHNIAILLLLALVVIELTARLIRRDQLLPGATRPRLAILASCTLMGLVCYGIGRTESTVCDPMSVVQLHALWHVLIAAAAALLIWLMWVRTDDQLEHHDQHSSLMNDSRRSK